MSHSPIEVNDGPLNPEYRKGWSKITELIETGGSWSGRERNCCYLNIGGATAFADVSYASGLDFADDARAVAAVDWDGDGDQDLWIANRTAPRLRFLRNNGTPGHSGLGVRLQGTTGNRDAIGARLELLGTDGSQPAIVRTVQAGSGYLAQSSKWVHFGTGTATAPRDLRVHWPGGKTETIRGLAPGGRYTVIEGSAAARPSPVRRISLADGALVPVPPSGKARIALIERLPLPQLDFLDEERGPVAMDARQPTLINLWATWCKPCLKELHEFHERAGELDAAGLKILPLSVDGLSEGQPATVEVVRAHLEHYKLPFAANRITADAVDRLDVIHDVVLTMRTQLDDKYTLPVPASFLLDETGRLAVIYKGPVSVDTLLADVATLKSGRDPSIAYPGRWFLRPHGLGSVAVRAADRLIRRGHLDDALPYARLAADLADRNGNPFDLRHKVAGVLHDLGNAWDQRKQLDKAEQSYRLAQQVDPQDAKARTNLGNILYRRDKVRAARTAYREALVLDPDQLEAHMNLGSISLQGEQYFVAVKHFTEAVRIRPRFPQAHNLLGKALVYQGRPDAARKHFETALSLAPKYEDAKANLEAIGGSARAGGGS